MADDEILRRLQEHVAMANEHMARGNELANREELHQMRIDFRAEAVVVHRALFAILDQLQGGGGGPAAAGA